MLLSEQNNFIKFMIHITEQLDSTIKRINIIHLTQCNGVGGSKTLDTRTTTSIQLPKISKLQLE
jgi:hypothetical protein